MHGRKNAVIFMTMLAALAVVGAGCAPVAPQATGPVPSSPPAAASVGSNRLDLHGKGLAKVPAYVFNRTDLEELDLSDNALKDSLPSELGRLTELQVLDISGNAMTGVPAEVGRLSKLRILDLSDNRLTGLPREIGDLRNLQVLDVRGNAYSAQDINDIISRLPTTTEVRR